MQKCSLVSGRDRKAERLRVQWTGVGEEEGGEVEFSPGWENALELLFIGIGNPPKGCNGRHEIILCMLLLKMTLALVWTNSETCSCVVER